MNLDEYLAKYGSLLGKQAEQSLRPLHVPGRDAPADLELLRDPFPAQAHVIEATAKALRRQRAVMVIAEMGVGKTIIAIGAAHRHAGGRPYRALVFCPGQLTKKWQRELEQTLPDVTVHQLESWRDVVALERGSKPQGAEWYVIARDRAKLGSKWRAAFTVRAQMQESSPRCPACGRRVVDKDGNSVHPSELSRKRTSCKHVHEEGTGLIDGCGSPLWQMTGELKRIEPASYIKKHLKGFFDYLILDEAHEEKGAETAQGNAAGALAAACRKTIALTGTLIGGYAEHLRPLLFRLCPGSLVREGFEWGASMPFSEAYGRIEKRITEKEKGNYGDDNRMSRGTSRTTVKYVRPGIMPPLFGRHLIDKAVFLSLAEVADNLPALEEECIPVAMDAEQARAYADIEEPLMEAIKEMVVKGDKRLLGAMLNVLLCYPDFPFDWGAIGYWQKGEDGEPGGYVEVCQPDTLPATVRPKEQALIDLCKREKAAGRQTWVYVQYTDKRDVQGRLAKLLEKAGLKVGLLRASVSLAKREEWIAKHAPGCDVVLSHPKLVETGLDLFDKGGRHNFSTLCFYETGYNLFTLRQASRRSWRIGQTLPCRVVYLYYQETMQARAMALMGKKLAAAKAIEGEFSSEGLVALAGDEGGAEVALARSLASKLDEGEARLAWSRAVGPVQVIPMPDSPWRADAFEVRQLMKRNGLTIAAVAARLGVSQYRVRVARKSGASDPTWQLALERAGERPARRVAARRGKRCGATKRRARL